MTATTHHIKINGEVYEFMMVPASDGTWMVHAGGAVPFGVSDIEEARDMMRHIFSEREPEQDYGCRERRDASYPTTNWGF